MKNWYHNIPKLVEETDKLYAKIVTKGGRDKFTATKDKMVEYRNWKSSLVYTNENFEKVIGDLGAFYVPKLMDPGPMFVFPIRSLDGSYQNAQTRPLEGSTEYEWMVQKGGKYRWMGEKLHEPSWFGNDRETLQRVISQRRVILVEGPFDLIACRLVAPQIPTMSTLTKNVGNKHVPYLRMLGVKDLFLMFDNEEGKDGGDGAGNKSMRYLQASIKGMNVETLLCPSSDPSKALESMLKAKALRQLLTSAFEVAA